MVQANHLFAAWPDPAAFTRELAEYLQPHARYLVEVAEVPTYYLMNNPDARPSSQVDVLHRLHRRAGGVLTGDAGYEPPSGPGTSG